MKLNKLSEDVLFYLFYNCPGEVYQLAAACELYGSSFLVYGPSFLDIAEIGGSIKRTVFG